MDCFGYDGSPSLLCLEDWPETVSLTVSFFGCAVPVPNHCGWPMSARKSVRDRVLYVGQFAWTIVGQILPPGLPTKYMKMPEQADWAFQASLPLAHSWRHWKREPPQKKANPTEFPSVNMIDCWSSSHLQRNGLAQRRQRNGLKTSSRITIRPTMLKVIICSLTGHLFLKMTENPKVTINFKTLKPFGNHCSQHHHSKIQLSNHSQNHHCAGLWQATSERRNRLLPGWSWRPARNNMCHSWWSRRLKAYNMFFLVKPVTRLYTWLDFLRLLHEEKAADQQYLRLDSGWWEFGWIGDFFPFSKSILWEEGAVPWLNRF